MKLYLIQHGEAKSKEEDSERPLNETGIENSKKVSNFISRMDLDISEVWHSTKLRAKETAMIFAGNLGIADRLKEREDIKLVVVTKENRDGLAETIQRLL